jgi:small subunit ribosomal protein S4
LFGPKKYDIRRGTKLPGMHGANLPRLSEYGKLLKNKQILKKMYLLTEKQFVNLVTGTSQKTARNKGISHDVALMQFLERRCDVVLFKAGFASTIIQARQMINHGHFMLNGHKHTIPSTYLNPGDVLELRPKLKDSPLYTADKSNHNTVIPSWIKSDLPKNKIELVALPEPEQKNYPVDVLKVIEFYARA